MAVVIVVSGTRTLPEEDEKLTRSRVLDVVTEVEATTGGAPWQVFVGDARGVDRAVREEFPDARLFCAEWSKYGKSAGPIRNLAMLKAALDAVEGNPCSVILVAFPDRKYSPGTMNCIQTAIKFGIECRVYPVG